MDTVLFIISSIGFGVFCSIPGLIAGYYWGKSGLVRNSPWWVLIATTVFVFGGRLLFPQIPLIYILVFLFAISPLTVYRGELWIAYTKGRWWWVEKDDNGKSK